MKSDAIYNRAKILKAIQQRPLITIFELVRIVNLPRSVVASMVSRLQREQVIHVVALPARPGINEVRRGYEIAPKKAVPVASPKIAIPKQWDALSLLFGTATVES